VKSPFKYKVKPRSRSHPTALPSLKTCTHYLFIIYSHDTHLRNAKQLRKFAKNTTPTTIAAACKAKQVLHAKLASESEFEKFLKL
jgi:hypothetical protein